MPYFRAGGNTTCGTNVFFFFVINRIQIDSLQFHESGSFRPWDVSALVVSAQFWGGPFRPRYVGRFGPGSFRPKSIPKCRLLRTGRQTNR